MPPGFGTATPQADCIDDSRCSFVQEPVRRTRTRVTISGRSRKARRGSASRESHPEKPKDVSQGPARSTGSRETSSQNTARRIGITGGESRNRREFDTPRHSEGRSRAESAREAQFTVRCTERRRTAVPATNARPQSISAHVPGSGAGLPRATPSRAPYVRGERAEVGQLQPVEPLTHRRDVAVQQNERDLTQECPG